MTDEEKIRNAVNVARQEFDKVDPVTPRDIVIGALVRAVELLASTPLVMPPLGALEDAARNGTPRTYVMGFYGPILAAKDARITELESRTPANEVSSAEREQYETTIELQKQRIAELETWKTANARFTDEWHEAVEALCELWPNSEPIEDNPPQGDWIRRLVALREKRIAEIGQERDTAQAQVAALEKRTAELTALKLVNGIPPMDHLHAMVGEKPGALTARELYGAPRDRFDELTAPVDANGKTPGQINRDAFYGLLSDGTMPTDAYEYAANAVLRQFGYGTKAKEALSRVRAFVHGSAALPTGAFRRQCVADNVIAVIDAEIAKIEGVKAPVDGICRECKQESTVPSGNWYCIHCDRSDRL